MAAVMHSVEQAQPKNFGANNPPFDQQRNQACLLARAGHKCCLPWQGPIDCQLMYVTIDYVTIHYVSGLSVDCQRTVSGLSVECQCGLTDFVSQVLAVDCQWAVEDVGWLSVGGQR